MTSTPGSEAASDSIEMASMSSKNTAATQSRTETAESKAGRSGRERKISPPKDIVGANHLVVPKIVLSSVDSDDDGVLLKHRRKHKRSHKKVCDKNQY